MDGPENSHGSMRASDEKDRFETSAETSADTSLTNSAPKMTQFLSRKLLTWGVEERGVYLVSDFEFTT